MGRVNRQSEPFIRRNRQLKQSISRLQKKVRAIVASVDDASESALEVVGESILRRSDELAPKKTGALRASSFVKVTKARKARGDVSAGISSGPVVTIGYNKDGSAPYAVFTHEIGPYKNPTTPGTQYKYLETALHERIPQIKAILRRQIVREMTGR